MSRAAPWARFVTEIVHDDRGGLLENVSSLSLSWFAMFSVFLMNVQLGQSYHQRDLVDHAASVAADTAAKTLCADPKDFDGVARGDYRGARAKAVESAVRPILGLAAMSDACRVTAHPKAATEAASGGGAKEIEVQVDCEIPCRIPVAAQAMCSGSPARVTFQAKQKAVAMGCDGGG